MLHESIFSPVWKLSTIVDNRNYRRKKFKFYFPTVGVSKGVSPLSPVDLFQGPACTVVSVGQLQPPPGTTGQIGSPFVVAIRTTLKGHQSLARQMDDGQDRRGNSGTSFVVSSRTTFEGYQPLFVRSLRTRTPAACGEPDSV